MPIHARRFVLVLIAALAACVGGSPSSGEENQAAAGGSSVAEIPAPPDRFDTVAELQQYCREVRKIRGEDQSTEVAVFQAVAAATDTFLSAEGVGDGAAPRADAERAKASRIRIDALQYLVSLDDPTAGGRLAEALESAQSDASPLVRDVAWRYGVTQKISSMSELDDQQASALMTQIAGEFKARESTTGRLMFLFELLYRLDPRMNPGIDAPGRRHSNDHYTGRLLTLLDEWIPKQSDDPNRQELLDEIAMVRRRVELAGQPLELAGKLLDGSDFDASACRGRVVLVDFWALWCVNCYRDAPEYTRLYEKHHGQGFDFVSVSLDENPEDAAAYLKKTGLPDATTLIGDTPETSGFAHPLAVRCGVNGIPFSLVIDRQGVVACVNAKGEELERVIVECLSRR